MEIDNADIVFEIARRTIHNLDEISKLVLGQDELDPKVFETTQHLNSLLGLLVLPKELWLDKQADESLTAFWNSHSPPPVFEKNTAKCAMLKQFVELLRHSIAHGNIEFESEPYNNHFRIARIRLWNHPDGKAKKRAIDFQVLFTVEQVERFARRFAAKILISQPRDISKKLIEPAAAKAT